MKVRVLVPFEARRCSIRRGVACIMRSKGLGFAGVEDVRVGRLDRTRRGRCAPIPQR